MAAVVGAVIHGREGRARVPRSPGLCWGPQAQGEPDRAGGGKKGIECHRRKMDKIRDILRSCTFWTF